MENNKRIGILTGGGDCPGLNAAIRSVTRGAIKHGYEVIGFLDGFDGLIKNNYQILDEKKTSGIIDRGGTILGSSGINPARFETVSADIIRKFGDYNMEALVVVGGNTTLDMASLLDKKGLPVIGIPKTIDNDVKGTDYTIGFQTAVQIATDALDRLRSTAESHHRVMLLEVMGRDAGWIATYAGMANGADAILIPEVKVNLEKFCGMLKGRYDRGKRFSVVVVAEGSNLDVKTISKTISKKEYCGSVGRVLEEIIQERTGFETRTTILGHVQRGGVPVAYDRSLATAFGVKAIGCINAGKYGVMTALIGNKIIGVPLEEAAGGIKTVNLNAYKAEEKFFG